MKKRLAALGLCLGLLSLPPMTTYAAENDIKTDNSSVISVSVPDTHKLTVSANEDIDIDVIGNSLIHYKNGETLNVERLSRQHIVFYISPKQNISKAYLNGMDITDHIRFQKYGYIASYTIPSVYQDNELRLEIKSDLPQTGYVNTYRLIEIAAGIIVVLGIVIVIRNRKETE